jgi:hypothetical protein
MIVNPVNTVSLASGAITQGMSATSNIDVKVLSSGSFAAQFSGTWVGTISFFGSADATNFVPISVYANVAGGFRTSITSNDLIELNVSGYFYVRIAWVLSSGTASVTYNQTYTTSQVHKVSGNVEVTNDVGNPLPMSMSNKVVTLLNYNSSNLFSAGAILGGVYDGATYSAIASTVYSFGTGATLTWQYSNDGGATWVNDTAFGAGTKFLATTQLYRLISTTALASGTPNFILQGTAINGVNSIIDNPAPSVYPYSSAFTSAGAAMVQGPLYVGNCRGGAIQITSVGTTAGSLNLQISWDSVTWSAVTCWQAGSTPQQANGLAANQYYTFSTHGAVFLRVYYTGAVTAGTTAYVLSLNNLAGFSPALPVTRITNTSSEGVVNAQKIITTASTNISVIKSAVGMLNSLWVFTGTGKTNFVKLYNKATAPVLASDIPILTVGAANGTAVSFNCGTSGIKFTAGISIAITAGMADTDATATSAGDTVVSLSWA